MIHIIRDQELMGNPNLKIASLTGNYEDTALIDFYDIYNPEITAGAFQAQFFSYEKISTSNNHLQFFYTIISGWIKSFFCNAFINILLYITKLATPYTTFIYTKKTTTFTFIRTTKFFYVFLSKNKSKFVHG